MTREDVIAAMREAIEIWPLVQEDERVVIRLRFRHADPERARATADRLARDLIDQHISRLISTTVDSLDVIEALLRESPDDPDVQEAYVRMRAHASVASSQRGERITSRSIRTEDGEVD